jgi:hypothetical protein
LAAATLRRLGASELQQLGGGAHGAGQKRLVLKPWKTVGKPIGEPIGDIWLFLTRGISY